MSKAVSSLVRVVFALTIALPFEKATVDDMLGPDDTEDTKW